MDKQEFITAFRVAADCEQFAYGENKALRFYTAFLQQLQDLLDTVVEPEITVSFFTIGEDAKMAVAIVPTGLQNLYSMELKPRTFPLRIDLRNNETVILKSFALTLGCANLIESALKQLAKRHGLLKLQINLTIIKHDTASLSVTFDKTL